MILYTFVLVVLFKELVGIISKTCRDYNIMSIYQLRTNQIAVFVTTMILGFIFSACCKTILVHISYLFMCM